MNEKVEEITTAIKKGKRSLDEIAQSVEIDKGEVSPILNALSELDYIKISDSGDIEVQKELKRVSSVEDTSDLVADRDYDFNPQENVEDYFETNGELTKIIQDVKVNSEIYEEDPRKAREPRYWVSGPTGSGKTLLARKIAEELDATLITIQGQYSLNEADLKGAPLAVNGDSIWVDGPLSKALLASQEQRVVLLIDEANRARPESKSVLYSVLDDRCEIQIEALGEKIQGNPMNLISIGTINEGVGYQTQRLDLAEINRLGNHHKVGHLGLENPEKEIELLTDRSKIGENLAEGLVRTSNKLRREAGDDGSQVGEIKRGLPTGMLVDWARTIHSYSQNEEIDDPIIEAMNDSVLNTFYREDNKQWVIDEVSDALAGAPVSDKEFEEWYEEDVLL